MADSKKTRGKTKGSSSSKSSSNRSKTRSKASNSRKSSNKNTKHEGMSPRVKAILYSAACVISFLLLIINGGFLWGFLRSLLFGIFGIASVGLPAFLAYM